MSIPVALEDLIAAIGDRGAAYVLTVSDVGTAHVVHAALSMDGGRFDVEVGTSTARNAGARPRVSVLYPSRHAADYSLIVDTLATVVRTPAGARLLLTPTRAVLHRPAPDCGDLVESMEGCRVTAKSGGVPGDCGRVGRH